MKVYRFLVLYFVLLVFMLSWVVNSNVEAQSLQRPLRGELCWEVKLEPEGAENILKLRFLPIGIGDYIVSGKVIYTDDGRLKGIIHGNAKTEGNSVLMTLVGSGKDEGGMGTSINHVIIDKTTLNGTVETIDHEYDNIGGDIKTEYGSEFMKFIPCPR